MDKKTVNASKDANQIIHTATENVNYYNLGNTFFLSKN